MRIVVLSGGIGAARFLRGLLAAEPSADVTAVVNTADDITLYGLRICPDLDTVMYTLGGGIAEDRGWGRDGETFAARDELIAYGAGPAWFGLGDRDLATHLLRTQLLASGQPLSAVTESLCRRWRPGARLLPMTDDPVETTVLIADGPGRRWVHFQEWWVGLHAEVPALAVAQDGIERTRPAPGVVDAIRTADIVLLAPSNPVVSLGPVLAVPGIRDAVRETGAAVVGLSPIVGGAPVRGMADRLLPVIGVDTDAGAVARHYGARSGGGVLDGWLVDTVDEAVVAGVRAASIGCSAVPLLMTDLAATAGMARAALRQAAAG